MGQSGSISRPAKSHTLGMGLERLIFSYFQFWTSVQGSLAHAPCLSGRCRRSPGSIQGRSEGGWASCSHTELPDKEEEMLFLVDFGTKDCKGDCCSLCWSWLVPLLARSGSHGMLQAVAEWSQVKKLPQVSWASLTGWGLAVSPQQEVKPRHIHLFH